VHNNFTSPIWLGELVFIPLFIGVVHYMHSYREFSGKSAVHASHLLLKASGLYLLATGNIDAVSPTANSQHSNVATPKRRRGHQESI
jgi:hypothetical protein